MHDLFYCFSFETFRKLEQNWLLTGVAVIFHPFPTNLTSFWRFFNGEHDIKKLIATHFSSTDHKYYHMNVNYIPVFQMPYDEQT